MQPSEENVVVQKETNLAGVLDSLISLDPKGDFMGPVDGLSAQNHSKGIEAPVCFAMMQEKIRTQQYSTWRMFVEDFERMCYNAMRCNQKRSIIWAAADDLLRRGKKRLEQYEGLGETLVALSKTAESFSNSALKLTASPKVKFENAERGVTLQEKPSVSKGVSMAIPRSTGPPEIKPPYSEDASHCKRVSIKEDARLMQNLVDGKVENQMTGHAVLSLASVLDKVAEETSMNEDGLLETVNREELKLDSRQIDRVTEDGVGGRLSVDEETDLEVDVEGGGDEKSGAFRYDMGDEATECSSSFESAGSASEGEIGGDNLQSRSDAESGLRDGNGAVALQEEDDGLGMNERGKKALDPDWKQYRRGIEWRCRWLELRTQMLQAKLDQYDNLMKISQIKKNWIMEGKVEEGTSARTVPVKVLGHHLLIHRRIRRRAEDADLDMGRHPVFSRYVVEREATCEREDAETQFAAEVALVEQDSMEQLLWQVEALQARVQKQKHILMKEASVRKNPSAVSKGGQSNVPARAPPYPSPKGISAAPVVASQRISPRGGSGAPTSSSGSLARTSSAGLARRRASDYDINNMVMPVNVGATFVEQVRHVDIETPQWRLVNDANSAAECSQETFSDEDTDDEHYESRHAVMEVAEREHRYMPPQKRGTGEMQTVGKGKLKLGKGKSAPKMAGKGSRLSLPSGSSPFLGSADNVPKRQRSSRSTSRRTPLLTHEGGESPPVKAQSSDAVVVKTDAATSEVLGADADANPSTAGSGKVTVRDGSKSHTSEEMEEG